jgi:hypothetical protein
MILNGIMKTFYLISKSLRIIMEIMPKMIVSSFLVVKNDIFICLLANYHGNNGPVNIGKYSFQPGLEDFLAAAVEKGYSVGDYNGENQNGNKEFSLCQEIFLN